MKQPKIKELSVRDKVMGFYLVKSKRLKTRQTGEPFLDIDLMDRTGVINAKIWDNVSEYDSLFERGDVIKVSGVVDSYKEQLQIKIEKLRKALPEDQVDMAELVPSTRKNIEEMFEYIKGEALSISNQDLKKLMDKFFQDKELVDKLKISAAARDLHHSYLGGLLEHIYNMTKIARFLLDEIYTELDKDLVIAGVILHDLGKIVEIDSSAEISYTKEGYLLGHIYLSLKLLQKKLAGIENFPKSLELQLEHIILSHHGEKEWGSPVLPATREAMLIHHIDNLDAKQAMVAEAIERDLNTAEEFTEYNRTLGRHLFKVRSFLEDDE